MGKPKGVLQGRWKVIDPAKAGDDGGAGAEDKRTGKNGKGGDGGGGGKKKDEDKPAAENADPPKQMTKKEKKAAKKEADAAAAAEVAKKDDSKSKADKTKPASKPASVKAPSSRAGGSDARFTKSEWLTLQEDDIFSFGELQLLAELVAQYDAGRWQMVASRFFDKTGRRVHPQDVRDKFAGLMG